MRLLLDITDDDRRGFMLYWEVMEQHTDALHAATMDVAKKIPAFVDVLKSLTPAQLAKLQQESAERRRRALVDNDWQPYLEDARVQGARYARMGIEFSSWFELIRVYRLTLNPLLIKQLKGDPQTMNEAMLAGDRFIDIAMATLGEGYLEAKQEIIASQSKAIRELSTPVLQVKARLLIVPLVGVIDTERARQVTENILHSIRLRRARAVVIDVTGVPIVDSKVANHLMKTVDAAGLMGAAVIVCGISPEIAQTLVTLGAEMRGVRTAGDLQEGIEEADAILRTRFADLENDNDTNHSSGDSNGEVA